MATPRSSGKQLFEEGVSASTLRLVDYWIRVAQKSGDLPDDDRLTAFTNGLHRAATRIAKQENQARAFTDALDCEEDP